VLDPVYANDLVYERYTRFLKGSIPLSDPSRIIITGKDMPVMPEDIFGKEPPHTWCYYYEKAELARQAGDWEQVAKLETRQPVEDTYQATLMSGYLL